MNLDLSFYWRLLLRRLPVMMLFVLGCASLGVITALKMPDTYATSARLLLEAPQIPENMVNSNIQTSAAEQLDIIQQKLLTRANLIDIANRFRVFPNIGEMNPDIVYEEMRNATRIARSAGRNRATLLTLSFNGRSPRVVSDVVNEYVTLVLEENSSSRINRAERTLDFFGQEVRRLNAELDTKSAEIAIFKSDNADALPDDVRFRQNRQSLLQERLAQLERDTKTAEVQLAEIVRIYENTGRLRDSNSAPRRRTPQEEQLIVAKAELEHARSLYSENHPRIIRLRNLTDRLEAVVTAQANASVTTDENQEDAAQSAEEALFQASVSELETRIESFANEIERTSAEIIELQEANAKSAANGIALAALERDYVNIQSRYNSALNSLNEAQMSERIESTAQGQRITVVENANVPQEAAGPNRPLVATAGAAIGIGLAGAYFILLELLNRTIRRPSEMMQKFSITPITVVPYMESKRQRWLRRSLRLSALVVVLIGVPLGLWYVDTNYVPLELVVQKGLARLGLG